MGRVMNPYFAPSYEYCAWIALATRTFLPGGITGFVWERGTGMCWLDVGGGDGNGDHGNGDHGNGNGNGNGMEEREGFWAGDLQFFPLNSEFEVWEGRREV